MKTNSFRFLVLMILNVFSFMCEGISTTSYSHTQVNTFTIEEESEKDFPIKVWETGVLKTTITVEGKCDDKNSLELFIGTDFNKDNRLELDSEEFYFRVGWNNTTKKESQTGKKNVTVVFYVDTNGTLKKCLLGESLKLGKYESGEPTDIMFKTSWNIMRLKSQGKNVNGKVTICLFKKLTDEDLTFLLQK